MLQTVRLWQGSDDGNYNCRHILRDHTAEVSESKVTILLTIIFIVVSITLLPIYHA